MIFNRYGLLVVAQIWSTHAFGGMQSQMFGRTASSALFMGKSRTMPGPSGSSSSGKTMSEFRQKKLSKKNKQKKNKGGFSATDDIDNGGSTSKKERQLMEIELVAEPEGIEVSRIVPESDADTNDIVVRLKDLGPVDSSDPAYKLKDKLGTEVHNFWLTSVADGGEIEKTRRVIVRDAAKNANFPGFRKGVVPPFAQGKMTTFALQEIMVKSCQNAIQIFGVNEINEDELGSVTFNEDMDALTAKYDTKKYPNVPFTANFRGTFAPREDQVESESGVIDVASSALETSGADE